VQDVLAAAAARALEAAHHVQDGARLAHVAQEGVAQAGALGGALDDARNVDDVNVRGRHQRRVIQRRQRSQARVGHLRTRGLGVNRCKGEVGRQRQLLADERVEERRLAGVG